MIIRKNIYCLLEIIRIFYFLYIIQSVGANHYQLKSARINNCVWWGVPAAIFPVNHWRTLVKATVNNYTNNYLSNYNVCFFNYSFPQLLRAWKSSWKLLDFNCLKKVAPINKKISYYSIKNTFKYIFQYLPKESIDEIESYSVDYKESIFSIYVLSSFLIFGVQVRNVTKNINLISLT